MVFKNPQTIKGLQNAVKAACKEVGGEKVYADQFAQACIDMGLNDDLPDGIEPIPTWTEIDYVMPSKRLMRLLALKEPERFKFNYEFVGATHKALLFAMPEKIRLEYLNSEYCDCGVRVVSEFCTEFSGTIRSAKLQVMKEASEAVAALATITNESSKDDIDAFLKEGSEAVAAINEAMSMVKVSNKQTLSTKNRLTSV